MTVDHDDDVAGLRSAARAVAEARDAMLAAVAPGVSTADLDAIGRDVLAVHGARPAPPTVGFPAATCVSVNDEAAHGIPSAHRVLQSGDLVNVDVSAELDGYWADTGASTAVGKVDLQARRLLDAARLANRDAVAAARAGEPLRHIGRAVERRARRHGMSVITNLSGHSTGRNLWEPPSVPGVEDRSDSTLLWEGLVLAIEPFLSTGATWAHRGRRRLDAAHAGAPVGTVRAHGHRHVGRADDPHRIMSDDPQDTAEALDEEVVDDVDDFTGDEYGEDLPGYPPDRPLGNTAAGTPIEEDDGESFVERTSARGRRPGVRRRCRTDRRRRRHDDRSGGATGRRCRARASAQRGGSGHAHRGGVTSPVTSRRRPLGRRAGRSPPRLFDAPSRRRTRAGRPRATR